MWRSSSRDWAAPRNRQASIMVPRGNLTVVMRPDASNKLSCQLGRWMDLVPQHNCHIENRGLIRLRHPLSRSPINVYLAKVIFFTAAQPGASSL